MSQWEVKMSGSRGVPYFFNKETQASEQIQQLPGAEHLAGSSAKSSGGGGKVDQVRASHLLVKHSGSRRPSSWKEANITRSKEEAIEILRGYQAQINGSPETFADLAGKHSDCSSHSNAGDLGWFGRKQMQKPFEDAAYGLKVGQISDVISSDSGVHLVMRTG
ncbi:rotamase-domain-containing protein [Infundibulicybe gibba]|nr:rotamase-domain-containing protein [Infundibulicybe gibba]